MKWKYNNLLKWIKEGCDYDIGNRVINLNISKKKN